MNALLIDDNYLYHALIVEVLRLEGIDVHMVSDAEAARAALRQTVFDLVLWDPYTHGINAMEMVSKLHERFPSLPIIALSRYSPSALIRQQILVYSSYTLVKPFTNESLLSICRDAVGLNKRSATNTAASAS